MNTIGIVGVLAFLIVSPAICDEGNKSAKEDVTQNPQPYLNSFNNELNGNWYDRQLRAPSGFFGVRGKKDYEDGGDAVDWNVENDFYYPYLPKRAPSGFVGMRGKKAPSGFFGMRGKKLMSNYEPTFSDDFQAELFHQLQKEREALANLMEDYNNNYDMEKRRPEGFVGLRGKKSVNSDDFYDYEKRVPMGFAGVRGKKDFEKRVPIASFFGMRGKKEPSSFFGVRKKPFFGKFVGVRGKKSLTDSSITDGDFQVGDGPSQEKRISGFVGMRG